MEHTAYRQTRSVFGIASIPNTDFGSIMPNNFSKCSHWVESMEIQHTAYRQFRSVFGIPSSIPNIGQYLGLMKSEKLEKFGINMEYIHYLESLG